MPDSSVEFAALLCSRLCHDLLSPVGAMNNGLELLGDEKDPDMRARVIELLADSARASADRLKFFRLAFGAGGGFGDELNANEIRAAIEGLVHGNARIQLDWMVAAPTVPKVCAKILLNLAMIAFDALVRGGRLTCGVEGGEVVVRAEGPRLMLDDGIRAVLVGTDGIEPTSRTSQAWLVRRLVGTEQRRIELAETDDTLTLGAVLLS